MEPSKQHLLVVLFLIFITTGQTQGYAILTEAEGVVEAISSATAEILLAATALRSEEVANALREAMVVRGVPVYLLIPERVVQENAGYAASLALAGAAVRTTEVGATFFIIDRRVTIAGELITNPGSLNGPTIRVDDEAYAAPFVDGFSQGFEAARPYQFEQ